MKSITKKSALVMSLILCLSALFILVNAIDEQTANEIIPMAMSCSPWIESYPQQKPINCIHENCGSNDGTAYQMIMYIRTCIWPDGDTITQVKREDVYVGCCDYPYA